MPKIKFCVQNNSDKTFAMYCPNCGQPLTGKSKFSPKCGETAAQHGILKMKNSYYYIKYN